MPIWPLELQTGWNEFFTIQYQVPAYPDGTYYWGLGMNVSQWDRIQTPAGPFLV